MNQKVKDSLNYNNQGSQVSLDVLKKLRGLFKGQTGGIADLLDQSISQLSGIQPTNVTQGQTGAITDQANLGVAQGLGGQLGNVNAGFDQLAGNVAGGYAATPEQIALIQQATQGAYNAGAANINQSTTQGLQQLRNELAPARGLRPNDTPIVDRGAQIVTQGNTALDSLNSQLQGQAAQAQLQYPLQVGGLQQSALGLSSQYATAQQQFLSQLQQQALQNRLGLANALSGTGLNIAGLGTQTAGIAKGSPITGVQQSPSTLQNILMGTQAAGGIAGGLGGLASGLGSLGLFGAAA